MPVVTRTEPTVGDATGLIELELAGARIRLSGPVDAASLRAVLTAVRASG